MRLGWSCGQLRPLASLTSRYPGRAPTSPRGCGTTSGCTWSFTSNLRTQSISPPPSACHTPRVRGCCGPTACGLPGTPSPSQHPGPQPDPSSASAAASERTHLYVAPRQPHGSGGSGIAARFVLSRTLSEAGPPRVVGMPPLSSALPHFLQNPSRSDLATSAKSPPPRCPWPLLRWCCLNPSRWLAEGSSAPGPHPVHSRILQAALQGRWPGRGLPAPTALVPSKYCFPPAPGEPT